MKFRNKLKQAKQIASGISDIHKCPYCTALMQEIKDHARGGHKPNEETKKMKQFEKVLAKNGIYQATDKYLIVQIEKAVSDWLAGKLVAGNEKATPYNEVILKLLAEIKAGEYKT